MIQLFSGLYTQIQNLKKKLKKLDTSKHTEKQVKEVVEALTILEDRYEKEKTKRMEKQKAKEQAAPAEVEKEAINVPNAADVGAVSQNAPAPAAAPGAPAATPDDQKVSCPLCGGLTFNDNASYQQHMAYTHASDIMPTSPGQKQDKLVASNDPVVDKVETDPKIAPGIIVPDSVKKHDEVVDRVEKDLKVAPGIVSEKEEPKFKLDDEVKPIRGSESTGKVMRWDGKPSDLVYVSWDSGPLADRDGFGGYYPHDLELVTPELVEAAMPMEKPACADCVSMKDKQGDLKTNYEGLLKDLKDERDIHYTQGNSKWVERLDQKIRDLEKSIEDKFGDIETKSCAVCSKQKEAGARNDSEGLVVLDHTPPRANSGPDDGGRDSFDEFQDEWSEPARDVESARGAPGSLFDAKTAPHVVEQLQSFLNAPYINAQISTLGGDEHVSIMLTISADPEEKWTNNIMQNSRYGNFSIDNDGTVEQFSGGFSKFKQPNNAMRKTHVKSIQQLIDVLNKFMAKVNTPAAPVTPSTPVDPNKTSALKAPVTQPTKLLVFKREFLATPLKEQEKHGGYEISQNGKKLFKINSSNSQPMSKEQIEFCAQIELTRGLKQAKLTEKIAFLNAGTKVYILAQDRAGKRVKFACMEQGLRGWAPITKFAFQAKEGEMRKHRDHIDNTYGHNGKEILVDCPNGSGNLVWLPINELLPIEAPPATPESLNPDLGAESAKDCPDCHGNFEGAEGETCPTCGRFAIQKEALRPALAPQILNRRQEVNASGCDQCDAAMINGVFCHETGCPNARKEREQDTEDKSFWPHNASLNKVAYIVKRKDGWHVLSEKGKNLGGPYSSREKAKLRLKQVEYFKHQGVFRPFSKQVYAEVLTDPYQTLSTHITEMRTRMDQVNERLQNAPAVNKTAKEDAAPEMDLAALFADLTQGIDLLETKLGGDDIEPELHKGVEELENKLWTLEEKLGLTPELSEHEKAEPEHKEVVEKAKEMDKEAAVVTDETIEETTNDPNATLPSTTLAPALPTIQNVQPTDQDNLEIPVPMPTSPPPPGQKWVYNDVVGAYVLMPETTDPSKLV